MPLLSWFLNGVYLLLLVLVSPILLWRGVRRGKYRHGLAQKLLGRLPTSKANERVIWFHAVSVGEVLQLETIIPQVTRQHPDIKVLITSTTRTGLDVARKRFSEHTCSYFPLDFSWAVKNALRRVQPELVVLVELELWPNFVLHAAKSTQLAMINGRLSERSFRGYRRIRSLIKPMLHSFATIGVQTTDYADRMRSLGASRDQLHVTGSIKFDRIQTDRFNPATQALRSLFQLEADALVLVAGSTQAPEEVLVVRAWKQLRTEFPGLRLVVVPRHKERFDEVVRLIEWQDVPVTRRSRLGEPSNATPAEGSVILLDTLGELSDCWGLADIALVGGSFGNRGGQNMIEPAGYGAAIVVGPNTVNFKDVMQHLLADDAVTVTPTEEQLVPDLRALAGNAIERQRMGLRAQKTVLGKIGASQKTIELINSALIAASAPSPASRAA